MADATTDPAPAEATRGGRPFAGAGDPLTPSVAAALAIEVHGLSKRYGSLQVLDGLDLAVPRGELVALLGPNGAGKTTTVEILEGYRGSDGGVVRVLGMDPVRHRAALHARVGLMLQSGGITPQGVPASWSACTPASMPIPPIRTSCSSCSVSATPRTGATSSCRAARSSAWRWRSPSSVGPSC